MTLSAHIRSSKSDTHQNQLAKCPNSTSCSKGKLARETPVDLLGLGARQLVRMHISVPLRNKRKLAASAQQGRNREDPPNKWFWQLLGMSPQNPLLGTASQEQQPLTAIPASFHGRLCSGKTPGARCRESAAASRWTPKN